ncbi:MAG: phosphohistidine phosphatase SixA [Acidobacteria bacterium]|nr:phosphohistidine phosphatase SixA [Acidobacteriota bacterium]
MQIYLLRHGIAEDGRPGRPDAERALTEEGRAKLRRVLKRARTAEVSPSLILASPYRRAVETAEVVAEVFRYKGDIVQSRAFVPEASAAAAWEELRLYSGEPAVLVASHEPLMSSCVAFLLGCPALQVEMKKAAMVRIDVESTSAVPRGILKWMITPALCLE